MVEAGRDTDSDFRVVFKKLNDGLRKQIENTKSCKWKGSVQNSRIGQKQMSYTNM